MENVFVLGQLLNRIRGDQRGVTAMEYGLIASLVAVVLISALTKLGTSLSATFANVSAHL
jgi:pilus assembly protein Flp/PilA